MEHTKTAYHLIVVGAGGTGSYFLKEYARYLSSATAITRRLVYLSVIDGDRVEEKNLFRQNFFQDSIGENKAVDILASMQETFEGIEGMAYPFYFGVEEDLVGIEKAGEQRIRERTGMSAYKVIPVYLCCVDNVAARRVISRHFHNLPDCLYFDSGNGFSAGQCIYAARLKGILVSPTIEHYGFEYEEDEKSRLEASCEELNAVSPQHLLTNMMAAMNLLRAVFLLLEKGKLMRGYTSFDAFGGVMDTEVPEKYGFHLEMSSGADLEETETEEEDSSAVGDAHGRHAV